MKAQPDFLLSKWYLDCVGEKGEAFIGYAATLYWKGLNLHYASFFTHDRAIRGGGKTTRTTLSVSSQPEVSSDGIHWSSPALKIEGYWVPLSPGIDRRLLNIPDGALQWKCFQPHARASIRLDGSHTIEGFGYVERIDLSIPPWQLPIDKLRWGRFLSERDALVWIEWVGSEHGQVHLFYNGRRVNDCAISDTGIAFDQNRSVLTLRDRQVLRQGALVSTALSMIPGIARLFPEKILRTRECKWLSRGGLAVGDSPLSEGWAIHEIVNFT